MSKDVKHVVLHPFTFYYEVGLALSPMKFLLILLLCSSPGTQSLFCYNGTFSSKHCSSDPLRLHGLNAPARTTMARIRCSSSVKCSGGGLSSVTNEGFVDFTVVVKSGNPVAVLLQRHVQQQALPQRPASTPWAKCACENHNGKNTLLLLCKMFSFHKAVALLCYNCSSTHRDWTACGGLFAMTPFAFNNSRFFLVNCTTDNAMCFVRSWAARSHFAWIVQRGCYQSPKDDPLLQLLQTPTRAMACKRERLAEAEVQVCLCSADWCNRSLISTDSDGFNLLLILTFVTKILLI